MGISVRCDVQLLFAVCRAQNHVAAFPQHNVDLAGHGNRGCSLHWLGCKHVHVLFSHTQLTCRADLPWIAVGRLTELQELSLWVNTLKD